MNAKHSLPPGSLFSPNSPTSQPRLKCCYMPLEEMASGLHTAGNELTKEKVVAAIRVEMASQDWGNAKSLIKGFCCFQQL